MNTILLSKYNIDSLSFNSKIKPSQLKPYRKTLRMIYDNPEFKAIYKEESRDTILRTLSYLEIVRIKSEKTIKKNCEKIMKSNDINDLIIKDITKEFINENIDSVKQLAALPLDSQPPKELLEEITLLSLKNR